MDYRRLVVACTGHRPPKLGGYNDVTFARLVCLAAFCFHKLEPRIVITGGALGWDQACAKAAGDMSIRLHVFYPFEGYDSTWPVASQIKAREIHSKAEVHKMVCAPGYEDWKLQARNEDMVDNAELVLALYDSNPGGTANCVKYAHKQGRTVLNCWDRFKREDF